MEENMNESAVEKISVKQADDVINSIIEDFGYTCFYIDENYKIKGTAGNFSSFLSLPEEKLNLNILEMLPQDLSVALNTAIRKAWKEQCKIFLKSVCVKQKGQDLFFSISVRPPQHLDVRSYTLIVFGQSTYPNSKDNQNNISAYDRNEYIKQLEAELYEVRSGLQLAVERVEATNEELQSSNEDLLSANKELQSSNKELRSLNKELYALNAEHQLKIKELIDTLKANLEIKKNEDGFRFLAEVIPQKVWTAQPDGKAGYFNKVWLDYTGKRLDQLVDYGWKSVVHPEDVEENLKLWEHAVKSGEDFEMERRLLGRDGVYRWHLSRSVPQKDSDGNIHIWVGTSTDIHDQKTASEALRVSEDYFRQLADQSPFMIWKVDVLGLCNYVNKNWVAFTGMSFENSMGLGWGQAFHPDESDAEYKKFLKAFNQREIYHSKFRLKSTKGEYHWVLAQANPLRGNGFEGYIGSLTDITEQELAQQATKLLMKKKDEFMSIASHELKTPITSMKASLQIAERLSSKKVEVEKIQSFIEKANKQVNKLTALVEDLLDVTKIQAGKLQFENSRFYIDDAIQDCLDQVQNDIFKHELIVYGDTKVAVHGDKHRLEQVIINFLSNAIKYSPEAEKVILTIKQEDGKVRVSITDFGIGIPKDKISFVFDRFFRVQESSQKFSGLGLGLFISAEIVKRHYGEVGVSSEEGKGSTFWFSLPTES